MNEFECILRSPCSMVHNDSDDQAVRVELLADVSISRTGLTSWFVCIQQITWFRFLVLDIMGRNWKLKKNYKNSQKIRSVQYLWNYFRGNQTRLEISRDRFWLNSESKVICGSWNLPLWKKVSRKTKFLHKLSKIDAYDLRQMSSWHCQLWLIYASFEL